MICNCKESRSARCCMRLARNLALDLMPLGLSRERFPSFLWPNVGQSQRNSAGLVRPGLPCEESSPTRRAQGFRANKRRRLGGMATASPRKRLDSARPGPRAKKTSRLGGMAVPLQIKRLDLAALLPRCRENSSTWRAWSSLAKKLSRLGALRASAQRKGAELVTQHPLCRKYASTWCLTSQAEAFSLQRGLCATNSGQYLCEGPSM